MIRTGDLPPRAYLLGLLAIISRDEGLPPEVRNAAEESTAIANPDPGDPGRLVRSLNTVRHAIHSALGISSGDWDLIPPGGYPGTPGENSGSRTTLGGVSLYLDAIRSPFNLGSIVRTAVALGVPSIGLSRECPPIDHPRVVRTAMGTLEAADLVREDLGDYAPGRGTIVALELGGVALDQYEFPETGILVVGSEELGIRREYLDLVDATISIPLPGPKASINVGVACGIALQQWTRSLATR